MKRAPMMIERERIKSSVARSVCVFSAKHFVAFNLKSGNSFAAVTVLINQSNALCAWPNGPWLKLGESFWLSIFNFQA